MVSVEDGCGTGQIAYKDEAKGGAVRECSLGSTNDCPTGYACQYSTQFSRSQCCGVNAGCPTNSVANIDPASGRAQNCNTGTPCPSGFMCQSLPNGINVCCSSKQDNSQPSPAHLSRMVIYFRCHCSQH